MAVCNVNILTKCVLCAGFVARLHLNVSVHNLLSNIIWNEYHKKRQSKTHLCMFERHNASTRCESSIPVMWVL